MSDWNTLLPVRIVQGFNVRCTRYRDCVPTKLHSICNGHQGGRKNRCQNLFVALEGFWNHQVSAMSTKTLSERLAELTSTAPSSIFNPDDPDYDDGTGAGDLYFNSN